MCKRGLASSTFLKLRSSSFVCAAAPMTGVSWDFVFIAVCVLYTAGSMVWELWKLLRWTLRPTCRPHHQPFFSEKIWEASSDVVYITPFGRVWHISPECARRTARYARVEARRPCKVCCPHCRAQKKSG